jgi:parallel beta-helix repeat protein
MKALFGALGILAALAVTGGVAAAIASVVGPPRSLASQVEQRAAGHGAVVEHVGRDIASALRTLDRGRIAFHEPMPVPTPEAAGSGASTVPPRAIVVGSADEARRAIAQAQPGDVIAFVPGTYRFDGSSIEANRAGAPNAPITVRAATRGSVVLDFDLVEGFHVSAPYWSFENLVIRGVCADHSRCEHAFHVVSDARHFVAAHNEIIDFNAHFKINGSAGSYPDFGLLADNVLRNGSVRRTGNPVTLIDLVAASHWRIVGNRISDFIKAGSDRISYGAFAKGGGADNRFERNVVVCEDRLRGTAGQRVGLSLGGGGTSRDACRGGRCITEQDRGVIASNLIVSCSDDGIYVNRAAMSRISHNTLIDTGGITARFGETSADIDGNLVDGPIRALAGASMHDNDNAATGLAELYLGIHPVRRLFVDTAALDLHWRENPPRRQGVYPAPLALCGAVRTHQPAYGAFEDISGCRSGEP